MTRTETGETGLVEFHTAGAAVAGEYHCATCGYGVTIQTVLPRCPMCRGESWEPVAGGSPARVGPLL